MTTRGRLLPFILAAAALATSQGCFVSVSNSETAPRSNPRHEGPPASAPAPALSTRAPQDDDGEDHETDEQAWAAIRAALERPAEPRDGILTFTVPRDDLEITVMGNDVPVGAGLASEFRFYRCPCGLINVIGQFVVADYEANDVIDALREGHIEVASVGPFLLHERPRLLLIRFFGENKRGGHLAKTLRTALSWTGPERMAPQKLER
jgi:hypothetical protein